MARLELKVPPDVVVLGVVALMWIASRFGGSLPLQSLPRYLIGATLIVCGLALIFEARAAFSARRTPFGPLHPSRATTLVTGGSYSFSRNPMYLGTGIALLGLGVVFDSAYSVVSSLLYAFYVDRFQIVPEERALAAKFGSEYGKYRSRVRRWV